MSAAIAPETTPALAPPPIPLCRGLLALLNMLTRCKSGAVRLDGRSAGGIGTWQGVLRLDGQPFLVLPEAILTQLEDIGGWALTFTPAVWSEELSAPTMLPLAFVLVDLAPAYRNGPNGWRWYPDEERARTAINALAAFPAAPALVIDGFAVLAICWQLAEPVPADDRARGLLRALATRFGGSLPEDDPLTATAPLPGSIVRNVGTIDIPVVRFVTLDPAQTTTITDLGAALADPGVSRRKGATAP